MGSLTDRTRTRTGVTGLLGLSYDPEKEGVCEERNEIRKVSMSRLGTTFPFTHQFLGNIHCCITLCLTRYVVTRFKIFIVVVSLGEW